jgi:hypothetical protein
MHMIAFVSIVTAYVIVTHNNRQRQAIQVVQTNAIYVDHFK